MHKQIFLAVCIALLAVLAAVGCGGSSAPMLTKAQFIKQGDAICKNAEKKKSAGLEAFFLKAGGKQFTLKQQEELATGVILPSLRTQADELGGLSAPEGMKDNGNAIVKEFDEVVGKLEENPLPLANRKVDPFTKVAKSAGEYGFKTCILYY